MPSRFVGFIFREGTWRERGVAWREGALLEVEFPGTIPSFLPAAAPEGYCLDAPLASAELAQQIAQQPWQGLFLGCDYGKSWQQLCEETPAGTARAYYRHTQANDLLAQPGEQDLTCHVCWDWLASALRENGFASPVVESQEAFFIRHAAPFIEATMTAEAARFSPRKLSLAQLLHPRTSAKSSKSCTRAATDSSIAWLPGRKAQASAWKGFSRRKARGRRTGG